MLTATYKTSHTLGRLSADETLAVYMTVREAQARIQGPEGKRVRSVDEAIAALSAGRARPALPHTDATTEAVQG